MTIYVSTGGFRANAGYQTALYLYDAGITAVELSSGQFDSDQLSELIKLKNKINFQIHNYFPPPKKAFVLNLGTLNDTIAEESISHVKNAIDMTAQIGGTRYSFHAGFLIDPAVDELGNPIGKKKISNRSKATTLFVDRVKNVAQYASNAGVDLMIENNVLSFDNYNNFGENPLLMCDPDESKAILDDLPNNVGLLLDVAHLKVSANSLGFDPVRMFEICGSRITGYHLSDNDGLSDTNEEFDASAWFWPWIDSATDYLSIEVYEASYKKLHELVELVSSKLGR